MLELSWNLSKDLEVWPLEETVSVLADVSELSTAKQRWRILSAYYGQVLINDCVIKMEIESWATLAGVWGGMLRQWESSRSGDRHKVKLLLPALSIPVNRLIILPPLIPPLHALRLADTKGAKCGQQQEVCHVASGLIIQLPQCSDQIAVLILVNPLQNLSQEHR